PCALNEQVLASAIAESALPLVSGAGPQTDPTTADSAPDVPAPTPTGPA
ncbi:exodeoxyribonuclease VII large subunit, partial [Paraburkholderia ginsengiterrae]